MVPEEAPERLGLLRPGLRSGLQQDHAAAGRRSSDLQREPLALNDRSRVTADGLQWIVQRRTANARGGWKNVIYCQTQAALIANMGYEVSG
jgi:hypothetical protein